MRDAVDVRRTRGPFQEDLVPNRVYQFPADRTGCGKRGIHDAPGLPLAAESSWRDPGTAVHQWRAGLAGAGCTHRGACIRYSV
jgi:hypothetical protein